MEVPVLFSQGLLLCKKFDVFLNGTHNIIPFMGLREASTSGFLCLHRFLSSSMVSFLNCVISCLFCLGCSFFFFFFFFGGGGVKKK